MKGFLWLAAFASVGIFSLQAQPPQRKIEFSDPGTTTTVVSNLNRLDTRNGSAKQAQEQLLKTIGDHTSKGPLDLGAAPFPYSTLPRFAAPPDAKTLERMDKRKNWLFDGMNELSDPGAGAPDLKESMHIREMGPDGRDKKKDTAVQKYLNGLDNVKKRSLDPLKLGDETLMDSQSAIGTNVLRDNRFALPNSISAPQNSMSPIPFGTPLVQQTPSGFGGYSTPDNGFPVMSKAQKEHRDDLLKLLEPRTPQTAGTLPGNFANPLTGGGNSAVNGLLQSGAHPDPLNPLAKANSTANLRAPSFDVINARALGLPDPLAVKPTLATVQPPPPLMPSSAFPKRKF